MEKRRKVRGGRQKERKEGKDEGGAREMSERRERTGMKHIMRARKRASEPVGE